MKATEIFGNKLFTHNCDVEDSLDSETIRFLAAHHDTQSYNYERLTLSGRLKQMLSNPQSNQPNDIVFINRQDGGKTDGLNLLKGADYILPLVFLRNALVERLNLNAAQTEVIISVGIRADVWGEIIPKEETDTYMDEVRSIYYLHYDLTRKYFKRRVESMTDEQCTQLLQQIENLQLTTAFLQ